MLPRRNPDVAASAEYSPEERRNLLELAHRAITAKLKREKLDVTPPTPHLGEKRGAFTTLHRGGQLRGCIGYPLAIAPLFQTIAETAAAAAFEDPRFMPVTEDELPMLSVEISVLSPLARIAPEEVEIGRHGLVVTYGGRRGLLLPQVPVEHGWDRETFLSQTCMKAGLAPDAWMRGASLDAFTAEVFGEDSLHV
jgi:AmmeMemoRadiSam system protein A